MTSTGLAMATEQELLERIRKLEAENSELHDKLDMIYAIVAPEEAIEQEGDGQQDELIQIRRDN
jgi:hypothetical protein